MATVAGPCAVSCEAEPRPGKWSGRARDSGVVASFERRFGERCHLRRVVGERAPCERAVERGDVGDGKEVEVEALRRQRLRGLRRPTARTASTEPSPAMSSSRSARRQVREGTELASLLRGDDERRDASPPPAFASVFAAAAPSSARTRTAPRPSRHPERRARPRSPASGPGRPARLSDIFRTTGRPRLVPVQRARLLPSQARPIRRRRG